MLWRHLAEPTSRWSGDTAGQRRRCGDPIWRCPFVGGGPLLALCVNARRATDPTILAAGAMGPPRCKKLLDNAMPMVRLLWQRETRWLRFLTALDAKAGLDKALREKIN